MSSVPTADRALVAPVDDQRHDPPRGLLNLAMTTYLRVYPDIEAPAAGEQEAIDGIIKGMSEHSETVEKCEHHAVQSHAKRIARTVATLTVAADLLPEVSLGLATT